MDRPSKLYQYQKFSTRSLVNLKKHQVFFSAPSKFNDPFDCSLRINFTGISDDDYVKFYVDVIQEYPNEFGKEIFIEGKRPTERFKEFANRLMREEIGAQVAERHENRGIVCFTEKVDDILMWGHYGAGHTGFCVEFDTNFEPFSKTRPVRYEDTFPSINPVKAYFKSQEEKENVGNDDFARFSITKFSTWEYEREWRAIHMKPNQTFQYSFDAITGVYFGLKMPRDHKEILALILQGINPEVQLYDADIDDERFALNFKSVNYTSRVNLKK